MSYGSMDDIESEMLIVPITCVIFPKIDVIYKYHKQFGGEKRQVLRNGTVEIKIETEPQLLKVLVSVARQTCETFVLPGECHRIEIPSDTIQIRQIRATEYVAKVDLNAVYYALPSKTPFYKLSTGGGDIKNMFYLDLKIQYIDHSFSEVFSSKPFLLKTEKPGSNESGSCKKLGAIEANTGTFNLLTVKEKFLPPPNKSDIAYHFIINDPQNVEGLVEGDVVGFFENGNSETYIKRLTAENKDKIVHAGVISRSAYLEANRSDDDDHLTDTLCVLGIVEVKIVGGVLAGERIYASNAFPGKAVAQSHPLLGVGSRKEILLGMALQTAQQNTVVETQLVKCFICVMLGVSSSETSQEITDLCLSQRRETKTEIKRASKRHSKRLCCFFSLFAITLALLGVLLYQIFAPGSNFRYWLCRRGSKPGMYEFEYIQYSPVRDPLGMYDVSGIEFTYAALLDKTSPFKFPKRNVKSSNPNHTVTHYYLNVDRCAYGYAYGEVGNVIGGYRKIGGGKVFAINWNCTDIYWAAENSYWSSYNKTDTLRCTPKMPY